LSSTQAANQLQPMFMELTDFSNQFLAYRCQRGTLVPSFH